MDRMPNVEAALMWAAQHDYAFALEAAKELGEATNREMFLDQPYYNAYRWRDANGPKPS